MKIRLATTQIQKDSIVDGEGIRAVIWTQGCIHNCPGCHNPETHSFQGGFVVDIEDIKEQINKLEGQDGITFSGGDPMEQAEACLEIAKYAKDLGFSIWCYTGYTFEDLLKKAFYVKAIREFLENIDVLVDGKFILAEKTYDAVFRGSKNQRLIDVKKSLQINNTVELERYSNSKKEKNNKVNIYV